MPNTSTEEYEELNQALMSRGDLDGLQVHVATEIGDEIQVFEVWESKERYEAFRETTFAEVADEFGIPSVDPEVTGRAQNVVTT